LISSAIWISSGSCALARATSNSRRPTAFVVVDLLDQLRPIDKPNLTDFFTHELPDCQPRRHKLVPSASRSLTAGVSGGGRDEIKLQEQKNVRAEKKPVSRAESPPSAARNVGQLLQEDFEFDTSV